MSEVTQYEPRARKTRLVRTTSFPKIRESDLIEAMECLLKIQQSNHELSDQVEQMKEKMALLEARCAELSANYDKVIQANRSLIDMINRSK